jgi:hypothetical protein
MPENPRAEAIVYFRPTQGGSQAVIGSTDFGHVFVEVVDHETGRSDYYDFWMGPRGQGVLNDHLDDGRREVHWQAHIPVSGERAERMLDEIESHRLQSMQYHPTGINEVFDPKNTCVTGTVAVLEAGGIHVGNPTMPGGLWEALLEHYGSTLHPFGISEVTAPSVAPNYSTPDAHIQHIPPTGFEPNFSREDGRSAHEPDDGTAGSQMGSEHYDPNDGSGGGHGSGGGGTGGSVDNGDSVFDDMEYDTD